MKPCHDLPFETLVAAAENGALSPRDVWHLDQCAGCRGAVNQLRDQAEALRRLGSPQAGLPLRERILRRARRDACQRLVAALRALLRETSRSVAGQGGANTETVEGRAAVDADGLTAGAGLGQAAGGDRGGERGIEQDLGHTEVDQAANATRIADLLYEVAILDRRLSQLGDSQWPDGVLGGLAGARPTSPDLARRTLRVLEQLELAWANGGPGHQPTATPSFRDSLAPR